MKKGLSFTTKFTDILNHALTIPHIQLSWNLVVYVVHGLIAMMSHQLHKYDKKDKMDRDLKYCEISIRQI